MATTHKQQYKNFVFGPLSLVKAVWKHRLLAFSAWVLLSAVAAGVIHKLPSIYRAETRILVESQRIPEKFVESTVSTDLRDRLNTLSQQILSYKRLLTIAQHYNLYAQRPPLVEEEIVDAMRKDVTIRLEDSWTQTKQPNQSKPSAFTVSYQGPNPRVVALVAMELGSLFVDENLRAREFQAASTSEFLKDQLAEAQKRLEQQEAKLTEYKTRHSGELPQQENSIATSMNRIQTQLQGVQDGIQRAEQQRVVLDSALSAAEAAQAAFRELADEIQRPSPSEDVDPNTGATLLQSEKLQRQLDALRQKGYTSQHPDVLTIVEGIAEARKDEEKLETARKAALEKPAKRAEEQRAVPDMIKLGKKAPGLNEAVVRAQVRTRELAGQREALIVQLASYENERKLLIARAEELQKQFGRLPVREQELASLMRDYQITQTDYKSLQDKKLAAEMATDMEHRQKAEKFMIIDNAHIPEKPGKPNRPLLYGVSSTLALVFGALLGPMIELKRNVLLGEWELPRSVPVIGHVPLIKIANDGGSKEPKSKRSEVGLDLTLTGSPYYRAAIQRSSPADTSI